MTFMNTLYDLVIGVFDREKQMRCIIGYVQERTMNVKLSLIIIRCIQRQRFIIGV